MWKNKFMGGWGGWVGCHDCWLVFPPNNKQNACLISCTSWKRQNLKTNSTSTSSPQLVHLRRVTLDEEKKKQIRKKEYAEGSVTVDFFCLIHPLFCFVLFWLAHSGILTENNMAVKHGLSLFLDLPPPALLCVLHFVEHVGPRMWAGQNIVSVGKRLLVLKAQWGKKREWLHKKF